MFLYMKLFPFSSHFCSEQAWVLPASAGICWFDRLFIIPSISHLMFSQLNPEYGAWKPGTMPHSQDFYWKYTFLALLICFHEEKTLSLCSQHLLQFPETTEASDPPTEQAILTMLCKAINARKLIEENLWIVCGWGKRNFLKTSL